jgi:chloramphenicol O-acetyltransferase type A
MPEYLDLETWSRRPQFDFFRSYDNPFFNICTSVDVAPLLSVTRANENISFFIAYHFLSIKAANEVEPFRYRLHDERVLVYERIHAGTIILLPDESFTFAYFDYDEDFEVFHTRAKATIDRALAGGPRLDERASREDLIHHSVVPWITFTSVSHARKLGLDDSVPKIAFGKYRVDGDRVMMPVSVEVHHALMDGLHVGRYFERFEGYLAEPRATLGL